VVSAGLYANLHLAQIHNYASTPPLSFLQAGSWMPSCRPNNSVKVLKAKLCLIVKFECQSHSTAQRWTSWRLWISPCTTALWLHCELILFSILLFSFVDVYNATCLPSALWHCWLGFRKMWCWRGYLSGAKCNLHIWCHCQPIISCFIKSQNGSSFLVPAYPSCPGKEAVKWNYLLYLRWRELNSAAICLSVHSMPLVQQ